MSLRESARNLFGLRQAPAPTEQQIAASRLMSLMESGDFRLERAKEDATWHNLSRAAVDGSQLPRMEKIAWARAAFLTEAFAKRGVLLKTDFCFGSGIDGPRGKQKHGEPVHPGVQVILDFWNDRSNQATMFSAPMQSLRSSQLLVDGGLFLLLFVGADGVKVRRLGSTLVQKIIADPDDATRPLYYAVPKRKFNFDAKQAALVQDTAVSGEWIYYRDFRNTDPAQDPLYGQCEADPDVYLMHVSINSIGDCDFGESDVITSLKWLQAAKQVAEDQGTISRASAALMNRLAVKTKNEAALAGLARSLRSTTEAGGPKPPLPGSINVESEGAELKSQRASTNATDAWQDGRSMRLPAAVGMGLPLHYLGDPENASLATARVMDTPTLKMLEAYQTLWRSLYCDLFSFVLEQRGVDPQTVKYDIPMPAFSEPEIAEVATAVLDAKDAGLITKTQAAQRMMELLGFDDIPERLEELLQDEAAQDEGDADALADKLAAVDQAQGDDDDNPPA